MKNIILFLLVVLLTISAVTSVGATYPSDSYEGKMIKQGYTEEDMLNLNAVLFLSEENVKGLILQKYDELKDWKKVREYYGVSEERYENYMIGEKMHQETLNSIPGYIFDEMEDRGWTQSQINNFVNRGNTSKIDWDYAWKECKSGRTIEEVQKERMAVDREKSDLDTEFVRGEMSIEEYEIRLRAILNKDVVRKADKTDNAIADAVKEINELRDKTRQRHKERSGITDEEIEYCKSLGMTNPMDMYQAKSISIGTNVTFEKVAQTYLRVGSWSVTVIEISDITPEEYIKSLEETIENDPTGSDNKMPREIIQQVKNYYSLNGSEDTSKTVQNNEEAVQDNKENEIDINDYIALMVGSSKSYVYGTKKQLDEQNSDVLVFVEGERSYVPVRFISENYGGKVEWVPETKTVNISFDDRKISLTIGQTEIYIDGQLTTVDVAPILKNGRTFLPLRACVNALDKEVFYSNGLILIGEHADTLTETEYIKSVNDVIENYFK